MTISSALYNILPLLVAGEAFMYAMSKVMGV